MSEKAFYAERNEARKDRTMARRQARKGKAQTLKAFTPVTKLGRA